MAGYTQNWEARQGFPLRHFAGFTWCTFPASGGLPSLAVVASVLALTGQVNEPTMSFFVPTSRRFDVTACSLH